MRSWPTPAVPALAGRSPFPLLHDTASGGLVAPEIGDVASLYVCGITPYDATHIGHAATYVAFDVLGRVWRDSGVDVRYTQNVTDVDDPLLERASERGIDWRDLADSQVELFRRDMEHLSVVPPDDFVAVTDVIDPVADAVKRMLDLGVAYSVPTPDSASGDDIYFDVVGAGSLTPWTLGEESGLDHETMMALSAERGGDPDRVGKRDGVDPLLWRAAREGEPSWPSVVGEGRPGWHIECSVIALDSLGPRFTVQGGGNDLIFPHHELSAGHATALSGEPLAQVYAHTGMVAYHGEKMSKSRGNLVFVSDLRTAGVDGGVIRLAILAHHYRADWEWHDSDIDRASDRLSRWRTAFGPGAPLGERASEDVVDDVREALSDDLDTPRAIQLLDAAAVDGCDDPDRVAAATSALLGIRLGESRRS